ncbi:hypothetical protein HAX54_039147, partial [Datura stramonium]|nr:hypothetical protein [Datura stramonium]
DRPLVILRISYHDCLSRLVTPRNESCHDSLLPKPSTQMDVTTLGSTGLRTNKLFCDSSYEDISADATNVS